MLLNTGSGNEERDSVPNQTIHGIDVIDAAKLEVEKVCKGVVSCADIIALATRDAVELVCIQIKTSLLQLMLNIFSF